MAKTNGNDLVSPLSTEELSDRFNEGIALQTGLTKREYFAAMAMQGMVSQMTNPQDGRFGGKQGIAYHACDMADTLIEALNKEEQQ